MLRHRNGGEGITHTLRHAGLGVEVAVDEGVVARAEEAVEPRFQSLDEV